VWLADALTGPDLDIERRPSLSCWKESTMDRDLDELVAQLDLDEKAALLAGADMWSTVAVDRVGIPSVRVTDGPNGARGPMLPAMFGDDSSLTSVCMPSGAALGASWDVELLERVGRAIGEGARTLACRVLLAPTVNLHRSPLGGRNFESYAEDPLLAGRLGAAFIRGAQGAGVACTVKHLAGNESEDDRMIADSVIDERTLREVHLLPFELAVRDGRAAGAMTSYNRLNGEYCADSPVLLAQILRGEWGFDGFVISDWFAAAQTDLAIAAGLDLEMPGPGRAYGPALADAVREGRVEEALVDVAVRRLLGVFDRFGALDDPPQEPASDDAPEHRAIAREAAAAGMVLLRNEGVLPLAIERLHRVAVIGPNADRAIIMGGGSASLSVADLRTPLDALRDRLGASAVVDHEPGVDIALTTPEAPSELLTADGAPGMLVELYATGDLGGAPVHTMRTDAGSLLWLGATPPEAGPTFEWRATTELRVAEAGRWVLSLVQTEPARLELDGEVVLDGHGVALASGRDFFGMGKEELTVAVDLSPEHPVRVEITSAVTGSALIAGAKLGIRPATAADGIERAVDLAAGADAVVIVVGTDDDWETEGADRRSMALPGAQDELVERVLDVAPNAVVVVNSGSVTTMPWAERAGAILQTWFGGEAMADALGDVLFGEAEPGGRLPTTIPVRLEHNPAWGNFPAEAGTVRYGEGVLVGHRWYESRHLPVTFPFGHGLSYSRFEIGPPVLSSATIEPGGTLVVQVPVTNVGSRRGAEVVQLYVAPLAPAAFRPVQELKAFAKVVLDPGDSTIVELTLDGRSFARWSAPDPALDELLPRVTAHVPWTRPPQGADHRGWVVDPGPYEIRIGRSSADLAHVLVVEAPVGGPIGD
jgi:beta-glucosidase